jgi:beta-glucosidase
VVSDCGAIDDMYQGHKVVATASEAAALGVKRETDLDCGGRVYPKLVEALQKGQISEKEIEASVRRLFVARMKLGMFDAPEHVRWAQIPFSVLDQPAHRELARQVARESIVLLKNDRNTLPLRKNLRTIAVIGPNANQWRMLLGNYNGIPKEPVTPLRGVSDALKANGGRVVYALGSDLAEGFPVLSTAPSAVLRTPDGQPGLRAEYFASKSMSGTPSYTATDSVVEADWAESAPRAGMNGNDFGVRWSGTFTPPTTGAYRLGVIGTMKVQLFLDDSVVARSVYPQRDDEFPDPRLSQTDPARPLQLQGGHAYRLRLDASESYGEAQAQLVWAPPSGPLEEGALAAARQADAVVLFLGLTANLEGEEMRVQIPGFRGGDRTSIDLPAPQQQLLEKIVAVGKPTVLVLLNGSALAVNWAQEHVPAIVEAWYPGQAGGAAIADVLFGDYNPAGRLPVTFYKSVTDLPPFDDYAMKGRTYRFFMGTPLYPFGHGLSYTTFSYRNLRTSAERVAASGAIGVSVDVTNRGSVAGDEVVQLYVLHPASAVPRPIKDLRGYRRVSLKPGETRSVRFSIPVSSLAYWNEQAHRWLVETAPVKVQVGASSADIRAEHTIQVIGGGVTR